MKSAMNSKGAQARLGRQIEQLGVLRNAGTRAVEFREWRQTTLTLIERLWPDQASRATRFRRIPFSPASANADDKITRDAFERGCAEARRLLRLWHAEIAIRGVSQEAEAPRLAEAVRQTLVEMQPAKPAARPVPVPRAKSDGRPTPKPSRRARKLPLREMLGFSETGAAAPVAGMPGSPVPPAADMPGTPVPSRPLSRPAGPELPPEFEHAAGQPAAQAPEQNADALAQSIDHALERARREVRGMRPAAEPMDPRGRTYEEAPVADSRTLVSYVARAFIALAADVEELGVPEAHHERVRLALLDLANHLDCGSVTWVLMRDAITLVVHYPALGRQALPLLLPFLENAA